MRTRAVIPRKLRRRKTKRKRRVTGRAVRLSNELLAVIEPRRKQNRSYDALFRKILGLPAWDGTPQPLLEGCLEVTAGRFFIKTGTWDDVEADANGAAVSAAVRNKTRKVNKPIRMREIA